MAKRPGRCPASTRASRTFRSPSGVSKTPASSASILRGTTVTRVFTSPLQRASRTCELAGFGEVAEIDPDLVEWDYGDYEGLTSAQIRQKNPDWQLFRDGGPGGESVADVSGRADRVIARLRALDGDALIFSSGHFTRVLAARWLGLDASCGRLLVLNTTTLSILGYDHDRTDR